MVLTRTIGFGTINSPHHYSKRNNHKWERGKSNGKNYPPSSKKVPLKKLNPTESSEKLYRPSDGLSVEAPQDRFSREPQIFPKFLRGSSVIFL